MTVGQSLVYRLVSQLNEISSGSRSAIEFDASEIAEISKDAHLSTILSQQINGISDIKLKRIFKHFLENFAEQFEFFSEEARDQANYLLTGGVGVAGTIAISGALGIFGSQALLGSVVMLAGGIVGVIMSTQVYRIKCAEARERRLIARGLRRLAESIR